MRCQSIITLQPAIAVMFACHPPTCDLINVRARWCHDISQHTHTRTQFFFLLFLLLLLLLQIEIIRLESGSATPSTGRALSGMTGAIRPNGDAGKLQAKSKSAPRHTNIPGLLGYFVHIARTCWHLRNISEQSRGCAVPSRSRFSAKVQCVRTLAAKVRTPKRQTLRPPSSVDVLSMLGVSCHLFVSLKIIKMEMHRAGHAHLRARSLAATFFLGGGELAGLSPVCSELQKKCEAN